MVCNRCGRWIEGTTHVCYPANTPIMQSWAPWPLEVQQAAIRAFEAMERYWLNKAETATESVSDAEDQAWLDDIANDPNR